MLNLFQHPIGNSCLPNMIHQQSAHHLLSLPAKRCLVSGVILIHQDKVLLIHHRKLDMWLGPGGHVEENEPPHLAAERECFEETGIKCQVFDPYFPRNQSIEQFLPSPIHTHIHWVCEENYLRRMKDPDNYQPVELWKNGCEQHVGFTFLAKPVGSLKITRDKKEIRDIGWFDQKEVKNLTTSDAFKIEFEHVFELPNNL